MLSHKSDFVSSPKVKPELETKSQTRTRNQKSKPNSKPNRLNAKAFAKKPTFTLRDKRIMCGRKCSTKPCICQSRTYSSRRTTHQITMHPVTLIHNQIVKSNIKYLFTQVINKVVNNHIKQGTITSLNISYIDTCILSIPCDSETCTTSKRKRLQFR